MCYWAYSVILSFGGESTLSGITDEFTESWRRAQTSTPRRVKKEACSEETAVAVGSAAVAAEDRFAEICAEFKWLVLPAPMSD